MFKQTLSFLHLSDIVLFLENFFLSATLKRQYEEKNSKEKNLITALRDNLKRRKIKRQEQKKEKSEKKK